MRSSSYRLWIVFFSLLLSVIISAQVFAQDRSKPQLTITGVDISNFPVVRIFVFGKNLTGNIGSLPLTLLEDRVEQGIQDSQLVDVGVQVAVVIDASRNILTAGNTGAPRVTEVAAAVDNFVQLGVLSAETDWLSAHTIGASENDFQTLSGWNRDHQAVANTLLQYQPQANATNTPLFSLIKFALDQYDNSPVPVNLRRHVVVFSDGFDALSAVQVDDVVNRSNRVGITIHTVLLGPETAERRQNLQRIADVTGGQYLVLDSNTSTEALWREIAAERTQRVLTYRMTQAEPRELLVAVRLPDETILDQAIGFPFVPARPAELTVASLLSGSTVERIAQTADAKLDSMEPVVLPILLNIGWPDEHPRDLRRLEYEVNGATTLQTEGPFDSFNLPIAELGEGNYTLRVAAVDELGLRSEAPPVSFRVAIVVPNTNPVTDTSSISDTAILTATVSPTATLAEGGIVPMPTITPTVTPSATTPITIGSFIPPMTPFVGTRLLDDDNRVVWLSDWFVAINRTNVLLATFPLIAILAFIVYAGRRRRAAPPITAPIYGNANLAARSQSIPADVESTVPAAVFDLEDDATEPVRVPDFIAPAYLILMDGGRQAGAHLPRKIAIEGGRDIKIGRKQNLCDIVIDDKRISRLHAAISEEGDAHFHIRDEGSAGGTFVNRRKLRAADSRILRHGDTVNFNDITYRFELTAESGENDMTEPAVSSDTDVTAIVTPDDSPAGGQA